MKEIETASYADHNTPYISTKNIDKLISSLVEVSKTLFKWFADNHLKANTGKRDLLDSGTNSEAAMKVRSFSESKLTETHFF